MGKTINPLLCFAASRTQNNNLYVFMNALPLYRMSRVDDLRRVNNNNILEKFVSVPFVRARVQAFDKIINITIMRYTFTC